MVTPSISTFHLDKEQKRRAALASVMVVTNGLMDSVNSGVAQVFSNQRKLEHETRAIQQQTQKFSKQTSQWLTLIENFNTTLKVSKLFCNG
jgi:hypothetical protein